MVQKSLVNYVRDLNQKGYDSASIRDVLLKYGYTNKDVDEAIGSIYNTTVRHEIHLSGRTIFVVILVLTSIIGAASFFYYSQPKAAAQLLDLNLEPVTTRVAPGESVVFLKELSNLGSSKRYDVTVRQEIISSKTGKSIAEKTETRAIETFGSTKTNMQIPKETKAGDYILRVIVEYDNKKAVATLPVSVSALLPSVSTESCYDGIKNQNEAGIDCGGICKPCEGGILNCDDNDPCTEDSIRDNACASEPISGCQKPPEQPYPAIQTLEDIKELAKLNPSKAQEGCNKIEVPDIKDTCISGIAEAQLNKNYCRMIVNERIKDLCHSGIAKLTNDNTLCDEISTDSRKDSCYMNFVLDNKDYSVCQKLVNDNLRQSCESLRQLSELNNPQGG